MSQISSWFTNGCPKCGSTGETTLEYQNIVSVQAGGTKHIHEEWLERTCRRCRYVAREEVLS